MRLKLLIAAVAVALIGTGEAASAQNRDFGPNRDPAMQRMAPPNAAADDPYFGTAFDDIDPYTANERPLYRYPPGSYFAPDQGNRGR
jgi:hypothetical protein